MNNELAILRWRILEPYIPEGFIGAELGVFKGHFSRLLLQKKPRSLYLVDPWYRLGPAWNWVSGQDPSTVNAFTNILVDFRREICSSIVHPLPLFSSEFMAIATPGVFDFIYLDSSHSYEDTLAEISGIERLLKPGGFLLGDDWHDDPTHRHYGVAKAAKEFINSGRAKLLFKPTERQWGLVFDQ